MNSFVAASTALQARYEVRVVPIRFVKDVSQIGRFSFRKLLLAAHLAATVFWELMRFRPVLAYMTPAPSGWAFYRDVFNVWIVRQFRVPLILHMHSLGVQAAAHTRWKRWLHEMMFRGSTAICLGKRLVSDIADVHQGRTHVVPNALPADSATIAVGRKRNDTDPVRFLYLSNLTRGKGLFEFLDALQRLKRDRGISFSALIAGSPNNVTPEELLKALEERDLLAEVQYVGPVYGADKQKCFLWADVFVFPTRIDTFPLVVLEAMQYGLPVISTVRAAIPDVVIDGETGLLADEGDVVGLAEKMEVLARDVARRKQMGAAGRERFERYFTLEVLERNLIAVFEQELSMRSASARQ